MALDSNLIRDFERKTRFDLEIYLLAVESLAKESFPRIVGYYTGTEEEVPSKELKLLDTLSLQSERLDHIIQLNATRFSTLDWWDLLELIEDIKVKLKTMKNTSRWARSSTVRAFIANNPSLEVQLTQGQTIERKLGEDLGYSNEHQDWYSVSIRNNMNEEKYTPDGGATLIVPASGGFSFLIDSIVDIIDSETIKGKDIYRKITWENDDMKVLSGDEAFLQDMKILSELKKGDNPEYVSHGLSRSVAVGSNINSIAYPLLVRQINQTFNTDDSIEKFSVTRMERKEDGLFIEMKIHSRSKQIFSISATL